MIPKVVHKDIQTNGENVGEKWNVMKGLNWSRKKEVHENVSYKMGNP